MFTLNVDLGQLIISGSIGTSVYFIKRTLDRVETRLDKHEETIFELAGNIQRLIGNHESWDQKERRHK